MTVIATGITGCLDNTDNENGDGESNDGSMNTNTEGQNTISYEQCGKRIIPIGELPSPAKNEAMVALEEGKYESDDSVVIPNVMDIEESYVKSPEDSLTYYKVQVETDGNVTRLCLEKESPPVSTPPSMSNSLEDDVMIDVYIENETTDEVLVSETIELKAGKEIEFNGDVDYRYGRYNAEFIIKKNGDKISETKSWTYNEYTTFPAEFSILTISDEVVVGREVGPEAHPLPCEWNDDGELVEGRTVS